MRGNVQRFVYSKVPSHNMRWVGYLAVIGLTGPLWRFKPWGMLGTALGIYLVEKAVNIRQQDEINEYQTRIQDALLSIQHGKTVRTAQYEEVSA